VEFDLEVAAFADAGRIGLERLGHVADVGDVGAQVVEGVPNLPDDPSYVAAQLIEGGAHMVTLGLAAHDAVEPEGQVGERLSDAIMQVSSDAGPLLVGTDNTPPSLKTLRNGSGRSSNSSRAGSGRPPSRRSTLQ